MDKPWGDPTSEEEAEMLEGDRKSSKAWAIKGLPSFTHKEDLDLQQKGQYPGDETGVSTAGLPYDINFVQKAMPHRYRCEAAGIPLT